jgi:hypothetical protein
MRYIIFIGLLLFTVSSTELKGSDYAPSKALFVTATWIGGTGNWDVAANWSTGIVPDATTDVLIGIAADVSIPAVFTADALSITVQNGGKLNVLETAVLNMSASGTDAINVLSGATFLNRGFVNVGSAGAIGGNGIVIQGSLSNFTNDPTGVVNLNNIASYAVNINLFGKMVNAGNLRIGSVSSIGSGGFAMDNGAQVFNQSTGIIEVNNVPTGDGIYMQDAQWSNEGTLHIGNISSILGRGISMELTSSLTNAAGATITISRITNSAANEGLGIYMSDSNLTNNGSINIGNNGAVNNVGLAMFFQSNFTNTSIATLKINNITSLDAISISDEFTDLFNSGTIQIGNNATVKRIGIFILNLALFSNQSTGVIEIDNINGTGASEGYGIYVSNAGLTNTGQIKLGTNFSIARFGINLSTSGALNNQSTGNIQVNNIANFDAISLSAASASFTNSGTISIGNLLAVKRIGINLVTSSTFTNNSSGVISINNMLGTVGGEGVGINLTGGTFSNGGSINIGNASPVVNSGIFITVGNFSNLATGTIQVNNITNNDGIILNGTGSVFTNQGAIKIGNLNFVRRIGLSLFNSSVFTNTSGSIEVNTITNTAAGTGYGITLSSSSTFTNNALINIGNIANISVVGLLVSNTCTFTNNVSGVLNISRVVVQDAIQILGATSVFNNNGQVKIGVDGPINRMGIIMNSGSKLNNNLGALIEINNISTNDGIQLATTSTVTNSGTINIGNVSVVFRIGIFVSSATFNNNASGIITINNIASSLANEGTAIRLQTSSIFTNANSILIGNTADINRFGIVVSSTSTLTNQSTGTISINRLVTQSAISLLATSKIFNNGIVNIGNTGPVFVAGISCFSGSEFNNNAGSTLNINNTSTAHGVFVSGTSSKLLNTGLVNIGNTAPIAGNGIYVELAALVQNNASSTINISNCVAGAVLIDGTGTIFNNIGLLNLQP